MSIGTNLWINGTLYSNVETVALPMSNEEGTGPDDGSGIQIYQDVHETTATASTVLSGYYFFNYDAQYTEGTIVSATTDYIQLNISDTTTPLSVHIATVTASSGYYSNPMQKVVTNASFSKANAVFIDDSGNATITFNAKTAGVAYSTSNYTISKSAAVAVTSAYTIYPSTSSNYVTSLRYLTGSVIVESVTTSNLSASYIVSGITIKVGDVSDAGRIAQVTGTAVLGTDTTDATLTNGNQMLSPYTAYANGTKYTGTIATKSASDVTAAGSQVTTPSGYYSQAVTKSISGGTATTPTTTVTVTPGIAINTNGVITATASGTSRVTPTVTAGYVAAGTSGTITVSGSKTSQLTSQTASTYYVSTADRTIASQRWLVGAQTIKSVTTTNLSASNVIAGVTIQVGDSGNASRIAYVAGGVTIHKYYTGSGTPSAGLGSNGDIYLQI